MINPFDKIVQPAPPFEQTDGEFQCEKCWHIMNSAMYFREQQLLVWRCDACQHESRLENCEIV